MKVVVSYMCLHLSILNYHPVSDGGAGVRTPDPADCARGPVRLLEENHH